MPLTEIGNCALCPQSAEETDYKGRILLRGMGLGLRGVRGRVVSRYPEGYRHIEACEPPAWCERRSTAV